MLFWRLTDKHTRPSIKLWNAETVCIQMTFTMHFLGFLSFCCTAGHVKRKRLEQTAVLTQDKCSAFGLKLFPQRLPLYSQAAGSAALSVCQLAHRVPYLHCNTHTSDESAYHMVNFIPPSLHLGVSLEPYKPKEISFITSFGGQRAEREVASYVT